jgi:hypothetical protein
MSLDALFVPMVNAALLAAWAEFKRRKKKV